MLEQFDPKHASPSYKTAGKGKPKCKKDLLPIKIVLCVKCHQPGGTLVVGVDKDGKPGYVHDVCGAKARLNRDQRREEERATLYRKRYMDSLGNKHRKRLAAAGITK